MKRVLYFLFFVYFPVAAQEEIKTTLINEIILNADAFISVDNFGNTYYTKNNVFYKTNGTQSTSYNNLQLGSLYSVNTFNPLKTNLFYKDFNTVILLDNRLAEIFKIDFNTLVPYKNVSFISAGYDNSLWIFNQDLQQLELFDYKLKNSKVKTVPVQSSVLDLKSNYNYCWLLTENFLYQYNYFGRLIKKIKNNGFIAIAENNDTIILKKEQSLFYLNENSDTIIPINTGNLFINDFFVIGETLYIYTKETLHLFQLKTH
ncbi:hypothetical protein KFZ70_11200 [Tamlana fucoidanivorans]|uniref:Uncharacterized protein n=1 Tax=Allotamlana fucoidanivorans TaxID=2583814 RepID=A0A5C4SHM5_9FLAO|nr:hypothetical protein [Tamlana fucoidanivorans]TNJ43155.1 hypothetical protein FGF67_12435 [Tamlana fucoidanivorans]